MKVTFDSNVWRIIATPKRFPNESALSAFLKIREAIQKQQIIALLSETVFTIEAIKKKDRKNIISSMKMETKFEITEVNGGIDIQVTLSPNSEVTFKNNPILKAHFDDAMNLGFKISRLPRIGGIENHEASNYLVHHDSKGLKKGFDAGKKIEELGAGVAQIKKIGTKYKTNNEVNWIMGLANAPQTENGNIARAAAEWADGDSIATCIAANCDYFCTRDEAKKAGSQSVLSPKNIKVLQKDYGIKIITPENLAKLI